MVFSIIEAFEKLWESNNQTKLNGMRTFMFCYGLSSEKWPPQMARMKGASTSSLENLNVLFLRGT